MPSKRHPLRKYTTSVEKRLRRMKDDTIGLYHVRIITLENQTGYEFDFQTTSWEKAESHVKTLCENERYSVEDRSERVVGADLRREGFEKWNQIVP